MNIKTSPVAGEFLLYQAEDGKTCIECRFVNETLWLSQAGMAQLFQTTKQNIAKHIKAIFSEGELVENSVVNSWLTTATDHKSYVVNYYNLDIILAVGYRVRSSRGTQFRQWATHRIDANKPNLGLTHIKGSKPSKQEIEIAKNYLNQNELNILNRMVMAYLELAELQALNRQPMYMKDWVARLDDFLKMAGNDILQHAGTISHELALEKANLEYEKYKERTQNDLSRVEEDFLKEIEYAAKKLKKF